MCSIQILSEHCSGCGAGYESQKASKIKRNEEEVWCKLFRSFWSSLYVIKKYTDQSTKMTLGQSNSLPILCILPLQRCQFVCFGLPGPYNLWCASYMLIELFCIHTWHRMIEAARWNKNGMLQCAMVSAVVSWLVCAVIWCQHRMKVQTSQSEANRNMNWWRVFVNIPSQSKDWKPSKCWLSVFDLATDVLNVSMKLFETFWRHSEVVWRTGFRVDADEQSKDGVLKRAEVMFPGMSCGERCTAKS